MGFFDIGPNGEKVDEVLTHLGELAKLGITHMHTGVRDGSRTDQLELFGERIIPAAREALTPDLSAAASAG